MPSRVRQFIFERSCLLSSFARSPKMALSKMLERSYNHPKRLEWCLVVSGKLTLHSLEKFDRVAEECDRLVASICYLDYEIKRLKTSANCTMVQVTLLRRAQADLEPLFRTLSWRLFWSSLRPTLILDRLIWALASQRYKGGRRYVPNVHSGGII
jgi:hypothetical protein